MQACLGRLSCIVRQFSSDSHEILRFAKLLQASKDLEEGRKIHNEIIAQQLGDEQILTESLAQMYLDRDSLTEAWNQFQRLANPPAILCTNIVTTFAERSDARAFHLFRRMQLQGVPLTAFLVVPLLKLCTTGAFLAEGKLLHACISEKELDREIFVGNTLITMYRKCGTLEDSEDYFWGMPERNQISWNAIVAAFAESGGSLQTLDYFHRMQLEGFLPNRATFLAVLSVFTGREGLIQARKIHQIILGTGYVTETSISNSILNIYSKNGGLKFAREAFDLTQERDIITWTTMMDAYSENGNFSEGFRLFRAMLHEGSVVPNKVTFLALIKGCCGLKEAKFLQEVIAESGYESNSVLGTNLIKMYSRIGSPEAAEEAFRKVHLRDEILWTALITAYAEHNRCKEAVNLFLQMQPEGLIPDKVTYTTVLDVCSKTAAIAEGKQVHACIVRSGIKLDTALENAILNMYGKCGKLEESRSFFNSIQQPDLLSWSIFISSHALQGHGNEALELFQKMLLDGVETDYCIFVNIISACRHGGLVDEGCEIFHRMVADSEIVAKAEQYGCIIDLLARSGQLQIAEEVLRSMPDQPGEIVWKAFLSACKEQGDIDRAKWAADKVMQIVPEDTTAYIILANALKDV